MYIQGKEEEEEEEEELDFDGPAPKTNICKAAKRPVEKVEKVCFYWEKYGECKLGDVCRFYHMSLEDAGIDTKKKRWGKRRSNGALKKSGMSEEAEDEVAVPSKKAKVEVAASPLKPPKIATTSSKGKVMGKKKMA